MSTDRLTIDEMIEADRPFVLVDEKLSALKDQETASNPYGTLAEGIIRSVDSDAPRLYALTVAGGSPHRFAAYINTTLPEFVPDVITIQLGMHSNVVILRARPSAVEKARREGRW